MVIPGRITFMPYCQRVNIFNEAKFIAVEFHCEASESNLNQSEWEVFDSDSNDDIFLEIDV